jgi:anti-anti-sigma factor
MSCAPALELRDGSPLSAAAEVARRVEDWVAGNLGFSHAGSETTLEDWHDRIAAGTSLRAGGSANAKPAGAKRSLQGWTRVGVSRRREATLARLRDPSLLKPSEMDEVAQELYDLIEAGHRRIAVDFAAVERLSVGFVPVLVEAGRRCRALGDGLLKVFNLRPELAALIALAAEPGSFAVAADESSALEGPWPEEAALPPLPDAVISALSTVKEPRGAGAPDPLSRPAEEDRATLDQPPPGPRLVAIGVNGRGRAVCIDDAGFSIGRDRFCRLRLNDPSVSRRHATLREHRDSILLRDLGSRNGTRVNGRRIHDEEVEVRHGDRIQIGSQEFVVDAGRIDSGRQPPGEDEILGWLVEGSAAGNADEGTWQELEAPSGTVRSEVIEGTLILTPLDAELIDESSLEPLRAELLASLERPLPRRVVLNLEHVGRISGAAVGLIVAHHLRLDRKGGELRLCQAQRRVRAVLEQVRLPVLMAIHDSVEDAVLAPWSAIS